MRISLKEMSVGDTGRVVGFDKSFLPYRQKMLAMGLTPGTEFTIIRIAPLGDPIEIRVRGTDLSLRQKEVSAIRIERLEPQSETQKTDSFKEEVTIAVIGNPNCGKTTLFNGLTGSRQHVGNWVGVTVEQKTGQYHYDNRIIKVVDLPGIYSLDVNEHSTSLDEKVARDFILSQKADLIINIIDTTHLEHNLYLTMQLLEMRIPMTVVLNNMDDVTGRDIKIDSDEIAHRLMCPLVSLVATQTKDLNALKSTINQLLETKKLSYTPVKYPEEIEVAINQLTPLIEQQLEDKPFNLQWIAVKLLEKDGFAMNLVDETLQNTAHDYYKDIEVKTGEEADILIVDSRYSFINTLTQDTLIQQSEIGKKLSDNIDKVILNRFLSIPIFFGVMYLMFTFTIKLGRAFKPFFKDFAQAIFVDGTDYLLSLMNSPQWLITLISGGVGNGIREVLAFVPILGFLYLFISILEESGYMARATFAMDRFMRVLGLPGKAFVPLILGFGCNVPAMMATRTLERPRDRLLNILLNPFMACGARLAVFTLFAAAFFPENGGLIVFSLYMIGVGAAFFTALLLKHTFLKEEFSLVIMEIPSYHVPKLKNVWINTWTRVKSFIVRVGKIIITMVLILHILSSLGTDGSFKKHNIENSVLSAAGRTVTPLLKPMGIDQKNWPATVAVFTGVLHKVVVISTLKTIYAASNHTGQKTEKNFEFWKAIKQSFLTIPMGIKKMLGINSGIKNDLSKSLFFTALHKNFHGQIGAYAYLLFVLLYFPCIATTSTAYKESSSGWASFMVVWATGVAYLTATLFYQLANFSQHPGQSITWVVAITVVMLLVIIGFRYWGNQEQRKLTN
ncbi:MAG: Fe(2+) transporter permease subunit FeoB [Methylococcaceae bacterium]|nr:Fe(2+) transporter permease subunit FeoB [Methylococcaceae bacterium]